MAKLLFKYYYEIAILKLFSLWSNYFCFYSFLKKLDTYILLIASPTPSSNIVKLFLFVTDALER
jgi:hypothetical protein